MRVEDDEDQCRQKPRPTRNPGIDLLEAGVALLQSTERAKHQAIRLHVEHTGVAVCGKIAETTQSDDGLRDQYGERDGCCAAAAGRASSMQQAQHQRGGPKNIELLLDA